MTETPHFELVIPCFNEAKSLLSLIQKSAEAALKHGLNSQSFRLILVDNGSEDETPVLLKELQLSSWGSWFRVVTLKKNRGYGGGIWEGLKTADSSFVGFSHADLQCDPSDAIRAFIDCQDNHEFQLIKGKRKNRSPLDWFVSRVFELSVGAIWGFWCFELNAQPKVFSRSLIEKIKNPPGGISFDAFLLWTAKKNGFRIQTIDVTLAPRMHGKSHWNQNLKKRFVTFFRVLNELLRLRVTAQSQ